jgi:hypothetical protein
MHRDVLFKSVPTKPSLTLVGGFSEYLYVDKPIDMAGKLRLATFHNYAYHMGNSLEGWMKDVQVENLKQPAADTPFLPDNSTDLFFSQLKHNRYGIIKKIFKRIYCK